MRPVVVISRTFLADAYEYRRYAGRECTHHVRLDPVKVGETLPVLSRQDLETLRADPAKFFGDQP